MSHPLLLFIPLFSYAKANMFLVVLDELDLASSDGTNNAISICFISFCYLKSICLNRAVLESGERGEGAEGERKGGVLNVMLRLMYCKPASDSPRTS